MGFPSHLSSLLTAELAHIEENYCSHYPEVKGMITLDVLHDNSMERMGVEVFAKTDSGS